MFSSGSFEKNSLGPDNCSPGRNSVSNRLPVGIPSLADENQQIRIQLAVHKYNNGATSPLHNGRTYISPVRHSFLKNSLRAKNYEGDGELLKSDKKSGNQYEGVGAFPTVHLRKSSVRYRPIRRFNDVKVPYPELPTNRFLSHLPELCPDLKSSTRSVLDVLQDLSGKKIHVKDNEEFNNPRSRGLGGDYYLDPNAAYKPLFVQKPKVDSVLTKDNTTQTISSHFSDTPSSQRDSSLGKHDSSDPRAELRKKLAKQNNEIFASLSSSISSSFPVKRKIDKVLLVKDDDSTEGSAVKKSKILDKHNNCQENSVSKLVINGKTNPNDSPKLSRKTKLTDTSATSPNKDRLTTIFLDMRNTSPKSQVFQNDSPSTEVKISSENKTSTPISSATNEISMNKIISPIANGSLPANSPTSEAASATNSPNLNFKSAGSGGKKDSEPQAGFNFPVTTSTSSTTVTNVTQSNSNMFQFGVNTSSNFAFPKTTVGSDVSAVGFSSPSATADGSSVNGEKKEDKTVKPFTFESSSNTSIKKPDFSNFKFGIDASSPPVQNAGIKSPSTSEVTSAVTVSTVSSATIPQFSFGTKSNEPVSSPSSALQFGQPITSSVSSQNTNTFSVKPFGQNSANTEGAKKSEEKTESPKIGALPGVTTNAFGQGVQSAGLFTFGQQAKLDSPKSETKLDTGKSINVNPSIAPNNLSQSTTIIVTTQCSVTTPTLSNQTTSFLQTTTPAGGLKPAVNSTFSFGQKSDASAAPPAVTSSQESKSSVSFNFGQKTEANQNKPTEGVFGEKPPTNLFTFGQKSSESIAKNETISAQPPTTDPGVGGQNTLKPQPTSNPSFIFGQNASQVSTASQMPAFGQTSAATTNVFGGKSEPAAFGQMSTPAFGQSNSAFSNKNSIFASSVTTTSAFCTSTTTQPTTGFGTTTSSAGFGVPTTQSTFGTPVSRPVMTFGSSASTQPSTGFGVPSSTPSTTAFGGGTAQTTSSFGSSAFGGALTTQSNHGFATQPSNAGFGITASSPSFSQPFNNPPATSLGQTSSIFGSTTNNQNPTSNTGFGSSLNAGQSNIFGQKTTTDGGIFGQANKIPTPAFGQNTSQPFGSPSKFPFAMSTSNSTGFTTSAPNTTASAVFNFGSNAPAQGSTFSFGNNSSGANNTQSPFAFKGTQNDAFKFGASAPKEGTGFGGGNTRAFSFGGQMNNPMTNNMNNTMAEAKSAGNVFNFGNPQVSSGGSGFNFGATPSPSVFNFGGSGSSASSGSSFSFGTPQPGGAFGQTGTPSPAGPPFAVPGTFSIGSGSSQSRPRASSRLRRRP